VNPVRDATPSGSPVRNHVVSEVAMRRRVGGGGERGPLARVSGSRAIFVATAILGLAAACAAAAEPAGRAPSRKPDVIYEPSPPEVVEAMLRLADVGPADVVYDLGCGDGRIVIAAAKRGARQAIGVDIDPERIREARANARAAGVEDRVVFIEGDLFEQDLAGATVVTLYLLPELNLRLEPKLRQLPAGTRIVSHAFDMGDWKPQVKREVDGKTVYLWTVSAPRVQARTGR
jgi:SAM-dependent methyltransferase